MVKEHRSQSHTHKPISRPATMKLIYMISPLPFVTIRRAIRKKKLGAKTPMIK